MCGLAYVMSCAFGMGYQMFNYGGVLLYMTLHA